MDGVDREDRDRSFAIARRANALMREYGTSASPHAYAVWYTYVTGEKPDLNAAVKRLTARHGTLSDAAITELHGAHLDGHRLETELVRTNAGLMGEVHGIMEKVELALGSAEQYGASLQALTRDLADPQPNRNRLKEIVASLVVNTRDVVSSNRTLEAHLRESRREIEALRETLEATRLESLTDPLTGLSNRKHFEERLRAEVEAGAASAPGAGPVALILIDIDHFKRFNDSFGHLTGDQVLRLVAVVMREIVGGGTTLSRFGGEEFGILLPETARAAACAVAERVRKTIMERNLVKRATGESLGRITVSLGVAERRPGDTVVSLMERADSCLYAAKRAGRNRTVDDAESPLNAVA